MSYAETLERLKKLSDATGEPASKGSKAPFDTFETHCPGVSEKIRAFETNENCDPKALSDPFLLKPGLSQTPKHGSLPAIKNGIVPLVTCRDCRHFQPDLINPLAGLGQCKIDAAGDRLPWPQLPRRCSGFEITHAALRRDN